MRPLQAAQLRSLGDCEVDIELLALKETQQQVIRRGHGVQIPLLYVCRLLLLLLLLLLSLLTAGLFERVLSLRTRRRSTDAHEAGSYSGVRLRCGHGCGCACLVCM